MFWRYIWQLIWQLPKLIVVLGVFLVSTGMFAWWWHFYSPVNYAQRQADQKKREEIVKQAAIAGERMGRLFLAGGNLYDVDTGEPIFFKWLNGEVPQRLWYDANLKKLIARFPRGFVRYNLDGSHDAEMSVPEAALFSADLKRLVCAINKDVWRAEIDWQAFRFVNLRQITKLGIFPDKFFAANVEIASDHFLIFRSMNKPLRVDLETGEVAPLKTAMNLNSKHWSPDGKLLVGMIGFATGQFSTYDLDTDKTDTAKLGRAAFNDCQWLDNDRCAILLAGKTVAVYHRKQSRLDEVCVLDGFTNRIAVSSPEGRFVLCGGAKQNFLVDIAGKKTESLPLDAKGFVWLDDNVLMFSREVLNTNLRGTWLKVVGVPEKRITPEPFFVNDHGYGAALLMKDAGMVIIETRTALMKMKADGSEVAELAKIKGPVERLQGIENWKLP